MEQNNQCCIVECEMPLDSNYWNNQYKNNSTGWDLGTVSLPLKNYIDSISARNLAVLIPGCGNSYEAAYMLAMGFTNITVIDIAPEPVNKLRNQLGDNENIKIALGDFFEHAGQYDLILEQTFFCALPPALRQRYVSKMHQLLKPQGILAGVLFNINFENAGPPFGGSQMEYEHLFKSAFRTIEMTPCTQSVESRQGKELWFQLQKDNFNDTTILQIEGLTCDSCARSVEQQVMQIPQIHNVSISTNLKDTLIVSSGNLNISTVSETINQNPEYKLLHP